MTGPSRERFLNLRVKSTMNALKPLSGIRNAGTTPDVVSHLITDQIGVNHEQRGWQKGLACLVVTTKKVFRQQQQCRARCCATTDRDLLPDQIPPKEKHRDRQEYDNRG